MIFNIVFIIWLISLSIIIGIIYRDLIRLRYTKEAKELVNKPKKGFIVPGSGFFTIKEKRKALVNSDEKAYIMEVNNQNQEDA